MVHVGGDKMTHVLFVAEGLQHLPAAHHLASVVKEAEFGSAVFFPHKIDEAMKWDHFDFVINDVMAIPGFLRYARLVIFFTSETSPHCLVSVLIAMLAKQTGASVLVIQHGLFQPGLNYFASSMPVGFLSGSDATHAISHFDEILQWDGEDGIGCIGLKEDVEMKMPAKKSQLLNVLVSTNFNWSVLSDEDAFHFFRMMTRLKEKLPFLNFFHKGHPAEDLELLSKKLGLAKFRNLFSVIDPRSSFESALIGMDIAVTTPSTTVVDCINAAVPVFMFDAPQFRGRYSTLESIKFSTFPELLARFIEFIENEVYVQPRLSPFDQPKFVEIVRTRIKESQAFVIKEEYFLRFISLLKGVV
jgi:hypothetical protein